jgi:adenosylcobyric acid synthase
LGTSIHGVFDEPVFRRHYLNQIRARKRFRHLPIVEHNNAGNVRLRAYNRIADLLENHLNVNSLAALVGMNGLILSDE